MGMIDLGKLGFDLVLNKSDWKANWQDADNDITKHQSKWGEFAGKMGGTLKTAIVGGVAAIGVAIGAMAVEGVKSAIELDDTMAKFRASTGMTADEANNVKNTIKDLYKVNEASYEDIAKTAESLHNNMQMSSEDIKKYSQSYLDFAKVTNQTGEAAVGMMDDIGDAWSLGNDQLIPIMDKMKYSQEKFGLSIEDSGSALKSLAPAFQGLGMNVNDAMSYLNLFASTGIDSSSATTAFAYALKQVKNPEELQKAITDLQNTENATERAKKAVELFGAKAGIQMSNALKPGTQSIDEIKKSLEGADGAVSKASNNYDKSLKVQLELLKKQFQGLFTDIGDKLSPLVQKFVNWLQQNMPAIQSTIQAVFNVIGAVIDITIGTVSRLAKTFSDWYNGNSESATEFKQFMQELGEFLKKLFGDLKVLVETALKAIKEFWAKYGNDIIAVVKPIFEIIKTVIQTAMKIIQDVIKIATSLLKGDWKGAWEGIKQIFIDVFQEITKIIPNLLEAIGKGFKLYFKIFKDIGKNLFSFIWEGMKSIWESISKWVSEKIEWLVDKLAFWKSGNDDMSTSSNKTKTDGSHYNGLSYVPYDGYIAELHKGERVLTASENNSYSTGITNSFKIENLNVRNDNDAKLISREFYNLTRNGMRGEMGFA